MAVLEGADGGSQGGGRGSSEVLELGRQNQMPLGKREEMACDPAATMADFSRVAGDVGLRPGRRPPEQQPERRSSLRWEIDQLYQKQRRLGRYLDGRVEEYRAFPQQQWGSKDVPRRAEMTALLEQLEAWRQTEYELRDELRIEKRLQRRLQTEHKAWEAQKLAIDEHIMERLAEIQRQEQLNCTVNEKELGEEAHVGDQKVRSSVDKKSYLNGHGVMVEKELAAEDDDSVSEDGELSSFSTTHIGFVEIPRKMGFDKIEGSSFSQNLLPLPISHQFQ